MLTAIVLAGGLARRFQRKHEPWTDKLFVRIEGKPMVGRVVESVREVADEVILSTDSRERAKALRNIAPDSKIVLDDTTLPCNGPLLGIASSVGNASAETVVVIAGDMPFLRPESVLRLARLLAGGYRVVTPYWGDGSVESLFFAAERDALTRYSRYLCNVRYWRTSGIQRLSSYSLYVPASEVVSDAQELVDVNFRDDLSARALGKPTATKRISVSFATDTGADADEAFSRGHFFLAALKYLEAGTEESMLRAVSSFEKESRFYAKLGLRIFSSHALEDASRVLERMGMEFIAREYRKRAVFSRP